MPNILLVNLFAHLTIEKEKSIAAVCLSNHPAAITAWSNDFGYDTYFERQVDAVGLKDDILILLSTGGGDKNSSMDLVHAAKLAKKGFKSYFFNWKVR